MPITPRRPAAPSLCRIGLALALAAPLPAAGGGAEETAGDTQTTAEFELSIRGIPAGRLQLGSNENARSYSAAARMSATGFVGFIVALRYDAQVQGLKSGGDTGLAPSRYEADIDSGRRKTRTLIDYPDGTPEVRVMRSDPPREPSDTPVDPASQTDALDPLTAMWLVMRPVPRADACALDLAVFDGQRRSALRHTGAERTGAGLVCTAGLRRVAGYSREDMAEREVFALRMVYAPVAAPDGEDAGDLVHLVEAEVDSRYGIARLKRR